MIPTLALCNIFPYPLLTFSKFRDSGLADPVCVRRGIGRDFGWYSPPVVDRIWL